MSRGTRTLRRVTRTLSRVTRTLSRVTRTLSRVNRTLSRVTRTLSRVTRTLSKNREYDLVKAIFTTWHNTCVFGEFEDFVNKIMCALTIRVCAHKIPIVCIYSILIQVEYTL